jgi:hypothetical protein
MTSATAPIVAPPNRVLIPEHSSGTTGRSQVCSSRPGVTPKNANRSTSRLRARPGRDASDRGGTVARPGPPVVDAQLTSAYSAASSSANLSSRATGS